MQLFRPYDQDTKPSGQTADVDTPDHRAPGASKNRPTPTREQAQAARMAAIHPKLTRKQKSAADRAVENQKQATRMAALDNRPERVLMRNYVDSRRSILETMWAILLVMLALSMIGGSSPKLALMVLVVTFALWALIVACFINFIFAWQGFNRQLRERYPGASSKGLMFTMLSRMTVFRRLRQPAPVVKVGESY